MPDNLIGFSSATLGLLDLQRQESQDQTRKASEVESYPPAISLGDHPAQQIAQEDAHGEAEHKDRDGARALLRRIEITDQRVPGRGTARFAHAHAEPRRKQ